MANEKADESILEIADEALKADPAIEQSNAEEKSEDDSGEVSVLIAGVSPSSEEDAEDAPDWVKDLRKRYKETVKKNRELEEQVKQVAIKPKAIEVGPKPTLESCDYDGDKFEAELLSWQDKKRSSDEAARNQAKEAEDIEAAYKKRQQDYETAKGNLKVKDFSEAEDLVKSSFSLMQQAIIVKGANDSAVVVYALGKNPDKAKELAAIKDPVEFAFAVARLEGKLSVTTKKAPPPEKIVAGSGGKSSQGATNATLERLRSEAEKTGNYTKVVAYKNSLKAKTG